MELIGDWAAFFALAGAMLFTLGYGALAPWWRSPIGRNVFLFSLAHLAVFVLIVASLLWGVDWPGRPVVRAGVYVALGLLFWQRLFILITDQVLAPRVPEVAAKYGATHRACPACGK